MSQSHPQAGCGFKTLVARLYTLCTPRHTGARTRGHAGTDTVENLLALLQKIARMILRLDKIIQIYRFAVFKDKYINAGITLSFLSFSLFSFTEAKIDGFQLTSRRRHPLLGS